MAPLIYRLSLTGACSKPLDHTASTIGEGTADISAVIDINRV
jgi:hypothetical protein